MNDLVNEMVDELVDKTDEEIIAILGALVLRVYKTKNNNKPVNQHVLEQVYKAFNKPAKKIYNKLQLEYYKV